MSQDEARRDEIVRRTFLGLEEDLDDLRDELGRYFADYEGRLETVTSRLPHWLELPPAEVRVLFAFEFEGSSARLGPRAVAMGAARVEQMIANLHEDLSVESLDQQRQDALDQLERLERAAREQALDADAALSEMLDAILIELEERREADEIALRELVTTGDVDRGRQARKEIADLWEDQRARARELRDAWEPIEALVFEGIDATVAGVEELKSLVHRAVEGFGGTAHVADEPEHASEEARVTEKLATQTATEEWSRETEEPPPAPSAPHDLETLETPRESEEPKAESVDMNAAPPGSDTQVEEEPDAQPPDDSDEEAASDDDDPSTWQTQLDFGPTDQMNVSDLVAQDSPQSQPAPEPDQEPVEPPAPSAAPESDASGSFDDINATAEHEETRGRAMRVVEEWRRVRRVEVALISLPMVAFLAIAGTASLPKLLGATPSTDVHRVVPWLFPWGFAGVVTLTFIAMLLRHWRTRWRGRPELVQWTERPEEVDVVIERGGVRIGSVKYPQRQLSARSYRWESRPDGTFGWAVVLTPRTSEPLTFVASERNFTRWDQSTLPVEEVDPSSWQTSASVVDVLRARLGV
ncbi:MAG: hypothetical protein R3E66_15330 [bacterium]